MQLVNRRHYGANEAFRGGSEESPISPFLLL
jgi:hypothetical protein